MTGQVIYLNRTCMDCGKNFLAVIEENNRKPLNCWYWGGVKQNLKYQWFIKFNDDFFEEDKHSGLQRWLKENIPAYYYPEEEVTIKSIWKRWWLNLLDSLFNRNEVEMWTCPECVEIEEKRGLDTCPEEEV